MVFGNSFQSKGVFLSFFRISFSLLAFKIFDRSSISQVINGYISLVLSWFCLSKRTLKIMRSHVCNLFFHVDFIIPQSLKVQRGFLLLVGTVKKSYVRYISHEIRTPLNAVAVGKFFIR